MKAIWKYIINNEFVKELEMPLGASIVRVGLQGPNVCLWACVLLGDSTTEKRFFYFSGTGHPVALKDCYVGSFTQGPFEWHVWERG